MVLILIIFISRLLANKESSRNNLFSRNIVVEIQDI